jgi:hypothetical protein
MAMKHKHANTTGHPDRDDLLRAVRTGEVSFRQHLAECESCRNVYGLLLLDEHLGLLNVSTPFPRELSKHANLPLLKSDWIPRRTDIGKSVHDSWTGLPVTVTRDSAMGLERSLRFSSGPISLELVADRTPEGWRFAARCYRSGVPSGEFVLKIGRQRIAPGLHDCYSWTALQPPKKIQLLSPSLRLVLDTGTW